MSEFAKLSVYIWWFASEHASMSSEGVIASESTRDVVSGILNVLVNLVLPRVVRLPKDAHDTFVAAAHKSME